MSRIKLLLDVVEDMKALSESLEILAKAIEDPEETDKEEAAEQMEETVETDKGEAEEQLKEENTETKKAEPVQYKMEDVRRALSAKSSDGKTAQVKELLLRHGAPKLSAINPSEYPAMMKEAEEL